MHSPASVPNSLIADRLWTALARISSADLTHTKDEAPGFPARGERVDPLDELLDRPEGTAPDGPAGEDAEPRLDLVHPGGRGRGEVERDPGPLGEPGPHGRRRVGTHAVEDAVELPFGIGEASSPRITSK